MNHIPWYCQRCGREIRFYKAGYLSYRERVQRGLSSAQEAIGHGWCEALGREGSGALEVKNKK